MASRQEIEFQSARGSLRRQHVAGRAEIRRWRKLILWATLIATAGGILADGAVPSLAWGPLAALLGGIFVVYAFGCWRHGLWLANSWLLVPAVGFLAEVCWQWRFASAYPGATLSGLIQLVVSGLVLILGLYCFQSNANVRRFAVAVWIFCGALGAEAIAQHYTAGPNIYWHWARPFGTPIGPYVYHNLFAGCMVLLLPLATAMALRRKSGVRGQAAWLRKVRRGILPALGLIALILSQSRGGVLALLFEAVVALPLFWPELRRRSRRLGLLVAGAAVAATVGLSSLGPLLQRFGHLADHDVSALERLQVAKTCLAIWRDHLWHGTGFGTFASVYPRYQVFDNGLRWLQAHNDYAQMLAEMGLIGAVLVVAFLVLYLRFALRALTTPEGERVLRKAAFVGSVGFLFHAAGDFQFHAPANAMLFFLMAAAAVVPTPARDPANIGFVSSPASQGKLSTLPASEGRG